MTDLASYADAAEVLNVPGFADAPQSAIALHDTLTKGLPASALLTAVQNVAVLRDPKVFEAVMGMSQRTYQRLKDQPGRNLGPESSGRLWRFAEILARVARLQGSQAAAERWLMQPAMALDQRRPIDLLTTATGAGLVEELLGRLEYGVYT